MNNQSIVSKASRVRQRGQGMTEYIIITALIAIAAIAAVTYFGGTARAQIGGMAQELSGTSAKASIGDAKNQAGKAAKEGKSGNTKGLGNYNNSTAN
jgi:pilus assembly protein Flp/PilA